MAESRNFLDRYFSEDEDGDSVLPYSIALIPGLTALEQDALIRDISQGLVKNSLKGDSLKVYDAIKKRKMADELEHSIHRMPEPLQDSWLMSASDGKGQLVFYDDKPQDVDIKGKAPAGFYHPQKRNVYLKRDMFDLNQLTAIHEYDHKANHDLNVEHPYYISLNNSPESIPDRMLGKNIGKNVLDDFPSNFGGKDIGLINSYNGDNVPKLVYDAGYLKPVPYEKLGDKNAERHSHAVRQFSNDIFGLRPGSVSTQFNMIYNNGHDIDYRDDSYRAAKRIGSELLNRGMTRDFVNEENVSSGMAYDVMKDVARNAALSVESAAEIAEILATEGGEDYIKSRFPTPYETMLDEYRNDPRRFFPKEQLRPWRLYSHESGENLYSLIGEPEKFDAAKEPHYVRVPTAYGDYVYTDDYTNGQYAAMKRGRNFLEYRDLDGKWQRIKPDNLKGNYPRMRTLDELAKSVGKNLPKMIKRVK